MIVDYGLDDGKKHDSMWAIVGFIQRSPSTINPFLKFMSPLIDMTKVVNVATTWIWSFRIMQIH